MTLIPRLNEVIFEIIVDMCQRGYPKLHYNKEHLIKSMNKFMKMFPVPYAKLYSSSRRTVENEVECQGEKGNFKYSDVLTVAVTVTKNEQAKPLPYEPVMYICCINQITQKTSMEPFMQHEDVV